MEHMVLQRAERAASGRFFTLRASRLEWKIHLGFIEFLFSFHTCFLSPGASFEKGREWDRVVLKKRLVAPTVCNNVEEDSAETTPTSLSSVLCFVSGVYKYFSRLTGSAGSLEDWAPAVWVGRIRKQYAHTFATEAFCLWLCLPLSQSYHHKHYRICSCTSGGSSLPGTVFDFYLTAVRKENVPTPIQYGNAAGNVFFK